MLIFESGAVAAAVADQHEHDLVARAGTRGELPHRPLDVRPSSTARGSTAFFETLSSPNQRISAVGIPNRLFAASASVCERLANDAPYFASPPKPAHDHEMRLRACRDERERAARRAMVATQRGEAAVHRSTGPPSVHRPHASPRDFRYAHSALTSTTSSRKVAGMSHRSI